MDIKKSEYVNLIEASFIRALMEPWHKRNHKLLQIGHHSTLEPSFFWDMGYDVTYLADNIDDLDKTREKNGKKIDYYLAQSDHLPFDEKVFDFVYSAHIFAQAKYSEEQKNRIMKEFIRVSAQGLCLIEYNSLAFSRLKPALSALAFRSYASSEMLNGGSMDFFTSLGLPSILWTQKLPLKTVNSTPLKFPLGSLMAMRIALSAIPMTPLTLKVQQTNADMSAEIFSVKN